MRQTNDAQLNILVIGAHPDDPDHMAGGTAALYARRGHRVKFVSLTNGDTGHYEMGGGELARRRYAEAQASAKVLGLVEYEVLDIHNGELEPILPYRRQVIKIIRQFEPDLVICHRPNDYHPDHRYASLLVQDAAYVVTVPMNTALTPHLRYNPVIVYAADNFKRPYPFTPDMAVDIDEVADVKMDAMHCHTSQMYEWLPYNDNTPEGEVPKDDAERRAWLARRRLPRSETLAGKYRDLLIKLYGPDRGARVRYAEAFEACEYGSSLTPERIAKLFPFFGG
jgi:LmbE family N-acetylglucosaminyl deacetylase